MQRQDYVLGQMGSIQMGSKKNVGTKVNKIMKLITLNILLERILV